MDASNLPDPILITHAAGLRQMIDVLVKEPIIAVDTEANSLYAYHEKVCLIQFSTPEVDYLVDPLSLTDLTPLAPIFSHPNIEKVFHAAEYDLIVLTRDFGFTFANLFDTMVAARIMAWHSVGLGAILKEHFGVHINKRFQRANWGRRPLSPELLAYARLDTHYLIPLRHILVKELRKIDRWALAVEDFKRACQVNGHQFEKKEVNCWRIHGAHDLSSKQAAILQEVCLFRDTIARATNRPLFKVIGNKTMLTLVTNCPRSISELKRLPGMSHALIKRHGAELLLAIQRGMRAKPIRPPRAPRQDNNFLTRVDTLRLWRKSTARKLGVESDVILPRNLLYALAKKNPADWGELENVMNTVPWRLENFGEKILSALSRSY